MKPWCFYMLYLTTAQQLPLLTEEVRYCNQPACYTLWACSIEGVLKKPGMQFGRPGSMENLLMKPGLLTRSHRSIVEECVAGAAVRCVPLRNEWHCKSWIPCLLSTAPSRAAEKINDRRNQSSPWAEYCVRPSNALWAEINSDLSVKSYRLRSYVMVQVFHMPCCCLWPQCYTMT